MIIKIIESTHRIRNEIVFPLHHALYIRWYIFWLVLLCSSFAMVGIRCCTSSLVCSIFAENSSFFQFFCFSLVFLHPENKSQVSMYDITLYSHYIIIYTRMNGIFEFHIITYIDIIYICTQYGQPQNARLCPQQTSRVKRHMEPASVWMSSGINACGHIYSRAHIYTRVRW